MKEKEFHIITDDRQASEKMAKIASHIHPYVTAIHIRHKTANLDQVFSLAQTFISNGVPPDKLYINSHEETANQLNASGVQLPAKRIDVHRVKSIYPSLRVGRSIHSIHEAVMAEKGGADYLFYGHIYETSSKSGLPPRGVPLLKQVSEAVSIPVIAIGGITAEKVKDVLDAGGSGIAVMSSIWRDPSPITLAKRYQSNLRKG